VVLASINRQRLPTQRETLPQAACLTLPGQHARVGRITYETREPAASPGVRMGNNRGYSIISVDCHITVL
jgi:hypothetical protein